MKLIDFLQFWNHLRPAIIPDPMIVDEYAICIWDAMAAPLETPVTVILFLFIE